MTANKKHTITNWLWSRPASIRVAGTSGWSYQSESTVAGVGSSASSITSCHRDTSIPWRAQVATSSWRQRHMLQHHTHKQILTQYTYWHMLVVFHSMILQTNKFCLKTHQVRIRSYSCSMLLCYKKYSSQRLNHCQDDQDRGMTLYLQYISAG